MNKMSQIVHLCAMFLCIIVLFTSLTGCNSQVGENTQSAEPSVYISSDGFWVINGEKTTVCAVGKDGVNGQDGKDGKDGTTPPVSISSDGFWIINGEKTTVCAVGKDGENGQDGKDGKDGVTPAVSISSDNFWVINSKKTDVSAIGKDGKDGVNGQNGVTPTVSISSDGFWVINGQKSAVCAGSLLNATVNVTADDENYGYVKNAGTYSAGDLVMLEAVATNSGEFTGWYRDGVLIGKDNTLFFYAEKGTDNITAKFTAQYPPLLVFHTITAKSSDTSIGTVTGGGSYISGTVAKLSAQFDSEKVRFDGWYVGNNEVLLSKLPQITYVADKNETITAKFTKMYPVSLNVRMKKSFVYYVQNVILSFNSGANQLIGWDYDANNSDYYIATAPVKYFAPGDPVSITCYFSESQNSVAGCQIVWSSLMTEFGKAITRVIYEGSNYSFVMPAHDVVFNTMIQEN